jgi:hypothetical protein
MRFKTKEIFMTIGISLDDLRDSLLMAAAWAEMDAVNAGFARIAEAEQRALRPPATSGASTATLANRVSAVLPLKEQKEEPVKTGIDPS